MRNKAIVSIEKAGDDLKATIAKAMQDADCGNAISSGDSVLIKPNLSGCVIKGSTSVSVIKAIVQWAYDMGACKVIIGEGPVPVGKEHLEKYLDEIKIAQIAREVGATFVNFDDYHHVIHRSISEYLPKEIGISKSIYEADKIINAAWTRKLLVREEILDSADSRLVCRSNKEIITVNANIPDFGWKRFAISHEIGHISNFFVSPKRIPSFALSLKHFFFPTNFTCTPSIIRNIKLTTR